ncbi:Flp1 family type IVb pilin [Cohnella algarum]|uniref:Flp1 family type IVb pilin n=1 Tax=Cohnella algarum TaxID=2044859 RepID=UPI001967F026|nr:Flp1 family type IVb pilin [Cohnella algarum]MBN2980066.1 multidrug transporter [Cohnella algarum]
MSLTRRMQRAGAKWLTAFWRNKEGLGTLEIVLIAAVIIVIVVLFRERITEFLNSLFDKVETKSEDVFS